MKTIQHASGPSGSAKEEYRTLYAASRRQGSFSGTEFPLFERGLPFTKTRPGVFIACVALVALLAVNCAPVMAQVIYGAIVGTVTDATGATVGGATIKVISVNTNDVRTATTGASGTYSVPNIPLDNIEWKYSRRALNSSFPAAWKSRLT